MDTYFSHTIWIITHPKPTHRPRHHMAGHLPALLLEDAVHAVALHGRDGVVLDDLASKISAMHASVDVLEQVLLSDVLLTNVAET